MSNDEKFMCYNRGCGKEYVESENDKGKGLKIHFTFIPVVFYFNTIIDI